MAGGSLPNVFLYSSASVPSSFIAASCSFIASRRASFSGATAKPNRSGDVAAKLSAISIPPCFSIASTATASSISAASTAPVRSEERAFVPSGNPRTSEASVSSLA